MDGDVRDLPVREITRTASRSEDTSLSVVFNDHGKSVRMDFDFDSFVK